MVMVARTKKSYVQELTLDEAWQLLEERAQQSFGISIHEFIRKWLAGEYGEPDDDPDALELAVLLPGVGVDPWQYDQRA
jgi:hypothetical protein